MNKLLRRLFFTIAILTVAAPAFAERGLFVVNNATCAGIPSPEANLTYCLPSSGVNQNQLMVWNGSAWVAAISGTGSAYATVRDEGSALAQRTTRVEPIAISLAVVVVAAWRLPISTQVRNYAPLLPTKPEPVRSSLALRQL